MPNSKTHQYPLDLNWTGNLGQGTSSYRTYDRAYEVVIEGKPVLLGSSDPAFRGDRSRYNPEELLVAAVSGCHLLWYLHLCAEANLIVTAYTDHAVGTMVETEAGGGHFTAIGLNPIVTVLAGSDVALAVQLHDRAHSHCFIANSVNFPIHCEPSIQVTDATA